MDIFDDFNYYNMEQESIRSLNTESNLEQTRKYEASGNVPSL